MSCQVPDAMGRKQMVIYAVRGTGAPAFDKQEMKLAN
jgi:hypothetical protein